MVLPQVVRADTHRHPVVVHNRLEARPAEPLAPVVLPVGLPPAVPAVLAAEAVLVVRQDDAPRNERVVVVAAAKSCSR